MRNAHGIRNAWLNSLESCDCNTWDCQGTVALVRTLGRRNICRDFSLPVMLCCAAQQSPSKEEKISRGNCAPCLQCSATHRHLSLVLGWSSRVVNESSGQPHPVITVFSQTWTFVPRPRLAFPCMNLQSLLHLPVRPRQPTPCVKALRTTRWSARQRGLPLSLPLRSTCLAGRVKLYAPSHQS